MGVSDGINMFLLLVTALGVFAAFRQVTISNNQKRADLILQLYSQFINDPDIQDLYYRIEYSTFKYDAATFHMSEDEKKLDKLLGLFSNIGKLYQMRIVKDVDLEFIKYEFQVLYEYREVQLYFETLDVWFKTRKINHLKFQPFRDVGRELSQQTSSN
jgi:hypothetical protein